MRIMTKSHNSKSRRVFFFTEAGKNIGLGHLYRSLAIAQAFEEKTEEIYFYVAGYKDASSLIPYSCHSIDWKINFPAEEAFKKTDIIVIDSYLASSPTYSFLKDKVENGVYIDDYNRITYPPGFVVNGQPLAQEIDYPQRTDITYLLGAEYQPIRRAFWGIKIKENRAKSILIIMGGNDIRGILASIVTKVVESFPNFEINVVGGKKELGVDVLPYSPPDNLYFHSDLDDNQMLHLMSNSYMALSAAGQTLFELAATGTPTVAIGVAENQQQNIKSFQQSRFIEFAGWHHEENILNSSVNCLNKLLDRERYTISRIAGSTSIDGLGCRRIVEEVLADRVNT